MQYGFHFDAWRCTGCKTCVMACKDYHDHGPNVAFRQVYEYVGGSWRQGGGGAWHQDCRAYYVSVACNHCANPVCVRVCPTGAMHKDGDGLVSVDTRRCVGCGYCAMSCPYHAPHVDRAAGHSVKCDGCAARLAQGLRPVCVEACPLRALDFGPVDELRQRWGERDELPPLPAATFTSPCLVITPPKALGAGAGAGTAEGAPEGAVANRREIV